MRFAVALFAFALVAGVAGAAPLIQDSTHGAEPARPGGPQQFRDLLSPAESEGVAREARDALARREADLREAIARDPNDRFLLHGLGTVLFHQGRADDATALWSAAARVEPNLAGADIMQATERVFALVARGETEQARAALADAQQRFGSAAHFLLIRGAQAERAGNIAAAEADYRGALSAAPALFVTDLALGRLFEQRDQHQAARQYYYTATIKAPRRPEPWLALASHQFREGDLASALTSFRHAAAASPRVPPAEVLMARSAEEIGDDLGGRFWYHAALAAAATPDNATRIALINVQLRLGLFAEANEELARLGGPETASLAFTRGVIAESMGDEAGAERHYRRALALAPESHLVQNNLAMVLVRSGTRGEEALKLAEAAHSRAPEDITILGTYACALAVAGRQPEAHRALAKAVRAAPRDPWVRYHLGLIKLARGQTAEARLHLEGALVLQPDFPHRAQIEAELAQIRR